MTKPKHPAKYADLVLSEMAYWLPSGSLVLDPFAGVGRLAEIKDINAVCIEVERDWASQLVGSAVALPFRDATFDAIAVSPCYGNRMADHHDAKDGSVRHTYKHYIGHDLHADNAGQMQWGGAYRQLHRRAWAETVRVLKPGGMFLLNSSDHIRRDEVQHVTDFHLEVLVMLGMDLQRTVLINTNRLRHGQNYDVRVSHETVSILTKGTV